MRKVTFGGANSLDNFIARPDHGFDWIMFGEEAQQEMADYWKRIDTVLTGRKTYEVMMRMNPGGGEGDFNPKIKSYVFSRTLKEVGPGATLVSEDVVNF